MNTESVAVELSVVSQVVERLAGQVGLSRVVHALDASAVTRLKSSKPVVIVYPLAEDAAPSVAGQVGSIQSVNTTVAVMHVVPAPNDPGGTDRRTFDSLSATLAATRNSLNGWKPLVRGEQRNALVFRRGRLISIDGASVMWSDSYELEWIHS